MNFLSHLHLSGPNEEILLGNFIADSVKGSRFNDYPPMVREGILLHRAIDHFTDHHPVVARSRQRIIELFHKYSGVVTDVFYDHFLAADWRKYHPQPLEDFAAEVYSLTGRNAALLPERAALFREYMVRNDILVRYARIEGIDKVMRGMARRTSFASNMENAADALCEHYSQFGNDFAEFFPDLRAHVDEKLRDLGLTGSSYP